ncbi:MAG: hypothetical protein QW476_00145 [Candidatus Bathyarchaeia archaeon]
MNKTKVINLIVLITSLFLLIILQSLYLENNLSDTSFNFNSYEKDIILHNSTYLSSNVNIEDSKIMNYEREALINRLKEAEFLCRNFMYSKMITNEGAVYSTFKQGYSESTIYGVNHEVTAESIGLLMLYAIEEKNKALFDMEVSFLKEKLLSHLGICYWKLKEDLSPYIYNGYASSALIDDLRIIEGLIEGYNLWRDDRYISLVYLMINGVFNYEVNEDTGILVDYYVWRGDKGEKAKSLTLAYARLSSILKIKKLDERGVKTFNETLKVILNGTNNINLFYQKYDIKNRRYIGNFFNSIEELMIALSLIEVGREDKVVAVHNFFKEEYLKKNFISDLYTLKGEDSSSDAGIGAYALLARLAIKLKDYDFALKIILEKILTTQEKDEKSEFYGAFINQWPLDNRDANSYDNLQALLTLKEAIKSLSDFNLLFRKTLSKRCSEHWLSLIFQRFSQVATFARVKRIRNLKTVNFAFINIVFDDLSMFRQGLKFLFKSC